LIVSDLCGPFDTSIGGYKYFITWIDAKSRFACIDFLKNKECSTVTASFQHYLSWLLRQKKAEVKHIRTDNGGEYTGSDFESLCGELGIIHETTSPYTPEHNSIAERYNRTLQEGALTLRHESNLSPGFWASAVHTVNFVKMRVLHSRLGITPYEAFWGNKPRIDWLRTYGSKCWALIPKDIRKKGQFKSIEGIFTGYFDNSKAYKVWIPRTRTIVKVRDVIFDELNHIERVTIHSTDEDDTPSLWTIEQGSVPISTTHIPTHPHDISWKHDDELPFAHTSSASSSSSAEPEGALQDQQPQSDENGTPLDTSSSPSPRIHSPSTSIQQDDPHRYLLRSLTQADTREQQPSIAPQDFEHGPWMDPSNTQYGRGQRRAHAALTFEVAAFAYGSLDLESSETAFVTLAPDEPGSYREAMQSTNSSKWTNACQTKLDTLLGYHTWDLVNKPHNINIVGNRWVFRMAHIL